MLGQRLREWRKEQGLTQTDAATRIGCTQSAYSDWETGKVTPRLAGLSAIAKALGVSLDDLVGPKRRPRAA